MIDEKGLEIAAQIGALLVERGETVVVSDAACGGLIGAYLVAVPGASRFFLGSTTAYTVKSRLHLTGWTPKEIQSYTGPSPDVAARLARNLRLELGATYALGENGWAGPADGPNTKVGEVYLSVVGPSGSRSTSRQTGLTDRVANMQEFARLALEFFLEELSNLKKE